MEETVYRIGDVIHPVAGFRFLATVGTIMVLGSLLAGGCSDSGNPTDPPPPEEDGKLVNVAGQPGEKGDDGEDGPAVESIMYWPMDMTVLPSGEILVMDWNNHRVRRISTDGMIHHFIGSGQLGDTRVIGADGAQGRMNHPTQINLGPDGTYWISTFHNWCIKNFAADLSLIQFIGDTTNGYRGDYPENGGNIDFMTRPRFDLPVSLVFDNAGMLYFSDQGNSRIRRIDLATRVITRFVGDSTRGFADGIGEEAQFSLPGSQTVGTGEPAGKIDLSPDGQYIYMADTDNNRIRKINIATREVTTIAGTGAIGFAGDGRPALQAELNFPTDVACSNNGDIYIADAHNHAIRKIDPSGIISTVAGTGIPGYSPDFTPAHMAKLNGPRGVAFDNMANTLYIADTYNQQIKKIKNP